MLQKLSQLIHGINLKQISAVLAVLIVAAIGTYLLVGSHAATPYASITAANGTVANGATKQTCAGSSDGDCVVFGSSSGGGGGGNAYCGFKSGTPTISKVMIIWEENESADQIIGNSSLSYMNSLAKQCGYTTNYYAYTHPSLPNYMAMTSGVSYASSPWNGDCSPGDSGCTTSNPSLFSQLGSNWKGYAESMPRNCYTSDGGPTDGDGNPEYAVRHNPAVYYTNITSACNNQDVPLGTTSSGNFVGDLKAGALQSLSTVTPNLDDDWHDGSPTQADNWLKSWVPIITAAPDYQDGKLAVLIIFDEGSGGGNNSSQTTGIWLSPFTKPGTQSGTSFNDYSVTKTTEDLLGKPELGQAANGSSMISAFNL